MGVSFTVVGKALPALGARVRFFSRMRPPRSLFIIIIIWFLLTVFCFLLLLFFIFIIFSKVVRCRVEGFGCEALPAPGALGHIFLRMRPHGLKCWV